jgi:hypothetical protein
MYTRLPARRPLEAAALLAALTHLLHLGSWG